jgi:hypothetical protein
MTNQEIAQEKEVISYLILENIQVQHDLNKLASLLTRQAWLTSEIKEELMN